MDRPDYSQPSLRLRRLLLHCGRFTIALCLLLSVGCTWLQRHQTKDIDACRTCIEKSFAAQQAGNLEEARELLNEAAKLQSDHAETWWNLAELSIQQDDYPAAVDELKRYVELQSSDPQGYLRLAQLYYLQNRYDAAEEWLDEVIRRTPNNFDAVMLSARLARKQADHQKAISEYYHALQVMPHHAEATLELSELLIARHEPYRASSLLRDLSRRALMEEDQARTHLNLGIAYGQIDRWDDAVEQLEVARNLNDSELARDRYRLAYAHWKSGGSQQALKLLIEMADSGQWNERSDALYSTITEGNPQLNNSDSALLVGYETRTAATKPFDRPASGEPLFLPDRLISGDSLSQDAMVPPEWGL